MGSVLREIAVDCADPRRLASFWADVLGWPFVEDPRGYYWLASTGAPDAPRRCWPSPRCRNRRRSRTACTST